MVLKRHRATLIAIAALVLSIVVTNFVSSALVEANGSHARDHLASAQGAIPLVVLLAVIHWAIPGPRGRLVNTLLWAATLATAVGVAVVATGNLQVIHAINGASWTDAQAGRLGSSRPGFDGGHDLVALGEKVTQYAAIVLTLGVTFAARGVRYAVGIAAAVLTLVFPPWINPAAGLPVLAIALVLKKDRESAAKYSSSADPPVPLATGTVD